MTIPVVLVFAECAVPLICLEIVGGNVFVLALRQSLYHSNIFGA
jgi:hypothetical protein